MTPGNLSLLTVLVLAVASGMTAAAGTQPPATSGPASKPAASEPAASQSAEPAEPATLHCQVFNQVGMGVAKATVEAAVLGAAGWIPLTVELTGRAGECDVRFPGPQPTLVRLKVVAAGYQDAESVYLPRPKDVVPWLTVTLKGAKSLEGRVVTEDGKGVAGAIVAMDSPAGVIHTNTNENGSFWFDNVLPMKATLAVQVPGVGIGVYHVDLTAEQVKPIEIVLHAQRRVMLRVLDEHGKALPGVMVEVLAPQPATATADSNGQIQVNGAGSGPGQVVVSLHDDYYRLDEPAVGLKVEDGNEPVDLEITATHGGMVAGQVVEKESGEPIPAAIVWFVADGKPGPNVTCDSEGKFKFEAIPEDEYLLVAGHGTYGFVVAPVSVEAGKKAELKFALPTGASIQGKVVNAAGKGAPQAIVRAATWIPRELAPKIEAGKIHPLQIPWRAVRADDDGQFLLENLPAGRISLEAADENNSHATTTSVQVPDTNKVIEMNVRLSSR